MNEQQLKQKAELEATVLQAIVDFQVANTDLTEAEAAGSEEAWNFTEKLTKNIYHVLDIANIDSDSYSFEC